MDFLHTLFDPSPESEPKLHFMPILAATILIGLIGVYLKHICGSGRSHNKLPPGSYGLPFVGESLSFFNAQKQNKTHVWFQERVDRYGPVFKTSLMGCKTVVFTGQAGNRFLFSGTEEHGISYSTPTSMTGIFGKHSLLELTGPRHKLLRGAVNVFVKPENIQRLVGDMDLLVRRQIPKVLGGKDSVEIVALMKKITFNLTSSTLFGLADGKEKDKLLQDFTVAVKGLWALPVNLPGTTFWRCLRARARVCATLSKLVALKRKEMEQESYKEDIISNYLNLRDENGQPVTEDEILDNFFTLIVASHDNASNVLTLLVRRLAQDPKAYEEVLQEQKEVLKAMKARNGRVITWSDLQMMKCTWRIAQEIMRLDPPVFGNFRTVTRDTTFQNFHIPKGWKGFWVTSGTHMDEKIFKEPEKFDPTRFETKSILPYTYVPFGAGPRICPGAEFSRVEVLLIIHHFVTRYKWAQLIPDEPITRDPFPYPSMGLPVKLFPRNSC